MIMIISLVTIVPAFAFSGGAGTPASPYQISNIKDLWDVRTAYTSTFVQTGDINLAVTNPANLIDWADSTSYSVGDIRKHPSDGFAYYCTTAHTSGASFTTGNWAKLWEAQKGWQPIGSGAGNDSFRGVYDGGNKIIYNLYINRGASSSADNLYPSDGEDNIGLFGFVENTTTAHTVIKNLTLIDPNVTGRRATGSLVGKVLLPVTRPARSWTVYIENCSAKPAKPESGTATVKGFGATGGLVGANNSNEKQRVPIIRFSHAIVSVSATHPTNTTINPADTPNPYNIKYGGLVGCNENGITQDSFARGSVSGGDRVGGLAGCTIGGSIYRSFATGTLTRGITPGSWTGGIGGLVGVTIGTLPPGLGGTNATGSCEDCFWDTQTSGIATSPGGTGYTTTQMKIQTNFTNWDFTNVWGINAGVNDGYPYLLGSPSTEFYYRTQLSSDWNDIDTWEYSSDESTWDDAVVTPDASNSISIIILDGYTVTVTANVLIDATTIDSGGKVIVAAGTSLLVDNGPGTDLQVNGILEVTGAFVPGINSETKFGASSELIYNGTAAQATGEYFFSTVDATNTPTVYETKINNLTLENSAGLTFDNPVIIENLFSVISGTYTLPSGVEINTDGVFSPNVKFFEFPGTNFNIENYSATMSQPSLYPDFVDRQWSITGNIDSTTEANRVKRITFYWTSADDQNFDWTGLGLAPALFAGATKLTPVSYTVNTDPRSITVDYAFPDVAQSGAKETFKIGRDDNQTLPVELSSFTAQINSNNLVQLIWVTQSETNVMGFRIYRSEDEFFANAQDMGILIPATNTSHLQSYVWIESQMLSPGTYYYWLESIDFGGENDIFGPIPFHIETGDSGIPSIPVITGISKAYPNPFNPCTNVIYGMEKDALVSLDIYNSRGQRVRELVNGKINAGWHALQWDGCDENGRSLPSGMYYLRMNTGSKSYSYKMTLMK
jgi:hypothetical protein